MLVAHVALEAILGAGLVAHADGVVGDAGDRQALDRVDLEPKREVLLDVGVEVVRALTIEDAGGVAPHLERLCEAHAEVALVAEQVRDQRALRHDDLRGGVVALPAHRDLELTDGDIDVLAEERDVEVLEDRERSGRRGHHDGVAAGVGERGVDRLADLRGVDHDLHGDLLRQDLALHADLGAAEAERGGRGLAAVAVEEEPALREDAGLDPALAFLADGELRRAGRLGGLVGLRWLDRLRRHRRGLHALGGRGRLVGADGWIGGGWLLGGRLRCRRVRRLSCRDRGQEAEQGEREQWALHCVVSSP